MAIPFGHRLKDRIVLRLQNQPVSTVAANVTPPAD
jgi:hypothetical protein